MPLDLQIPDDDLKGFSDQALDRLKEATVEYVINLIEEANRIEAGRNSTSGPPEVTRGMVNDARVLLRRGLSTPRTSWALRILRVIAAVLSLFAGIMYNENKLQSGAYMLLFILVVTAAILAVTISSLKE
ncbi:MAG TPA: hypothetical protein VE135_25915 [Pyrinomonadaceae bacterium]|nr:hypothetical protein [Pyrinomonadaceae bacterium]